MTWNQQTEATLNGWLGMQEKMFKGWWELLAQPQNNGHAASAGNPLWELWLSQGVQQWQTLYQENVAAVSQQVMADVAKHAASQFLNGQEQAQQLMGMVTEAWQAMLSNATSPTEWHAALAAYIEQLQQQMKMAFDSTKVVEHSAELWRLYYAEMQKLAQPWLTAWWQTPARSTPRPRMNSCNFFRPPLSRRWAVRCWRLALA